LLFVYNPRYDQTNTSQSLLCALDHIEDEDVLFINGDVVFDPRIVPALLACPDSCVAVISSRVAEEEVKFSVDAQGRINAISKIVTEPLGEAIGINLIRARDLALFKSCLRRCADNDYFERGMEFGLAAGLVLRPVDVTEFPCIEIDFADDLKRAKTLLNDKW
jgi:L-glutamine-phosphate cytidylyltransferase